VKRKEKYLFNMRGSAGPAPCPLPPLRWRSRGGGEGWRAGSCLGIFGQGRGDLWQASRELKWQVFLASKFGGLFSRVNPADFHGKIFWRVILAHLFGGSFWCIYLAGFHSNETSKFKAKEEKKKEVYNQ
jgi:hypothetical protein